MAVNSYKDLDRHYGHELVVVRYGSRNNIAIECDDCYEVLLDFDRGKDE